MSKRWDVGKRQYVESVDVDAFLADIFKVFDNHGMAISHEDGHGAFLVVPDSDEHRAWLDSAHMEGFVNE